MGTTRQMQPKKLIWANPPGSHLHKQWLLDNSFFLKGTRKEVGTEENTATYGKKLERVVDTLKRRGARDSQIDYALTSMAQAGHAGTDKVVARRVEHPPPG